MSLQAGTVAGDINLVDVIDKDHEMRIAHRNEGAAENGPESRDVFFLANELAGLLEYRFLHIHRHRIDCGCHAVILLCGVQKQGLDA